MRRPDFDDPDLPLSELFAAWPEMMAVFLERKMLCPGCPIAPFHAITDACIEYDLDEDAFRAELLARIDPAGPSGEIEPRAAARRWWRFLGGEQSR